MESTSPASETQTPRPHEPHPEMAQQDADLIEDAFPPLLTFAETEANMLLFTRGITEETKEDYWPIKKYRSYFDSVFLGRAESSLRATFYDDQGRKLVNNLPHHLSVEQRIFPRLEQHMPYFSLRITGQKRASKHRTPRQTPVGNMIAEYGLNEMNSDRSEDKCAVICANIGPDAHNNLIRTEFRNLHNLNAEIAQTFAKLPAAMKEEVRKLRGYGFRVMLLEFEFDHSKAAMTRIYTGTPKWGANFAAAIKQNRIRAICSITDTTPRHLAILTGVLGFCQRTENFSPLHRFQRFSRRQAFEPDRLINNPGIQAEDFYFVPRLCFFDKKEYMTVHGININSQMCAQSSRVDEFGDIHHVVFLKLPNAQDRAFLAYLKLPEEGTHRLSKGTRLQLDFDEHGQEGEPIYWRAKVIHDMSCPVKHAALVVRRPWNFNNAGFVGQSPRAIEAGNLPVQELQNAIIADAGQQVTIRIDIDDDVSRNLLRAVQSMYSTSARRGRTEWNDNIEKVLLCNRFDNLPTKDAFAAVRADIPDIKSLMHLNDTQHAAIDALQRAPAGLTVLNVPSGRGKAQVLLEVLRPFFQASQTHPVIIAASSNSDADAIAAQIDAFMTSMKINGLVQAHKYGLRAHSPGIETALRRSWALARAPVDLADRPAVWDTELLTDSFKASLSSTYKAAVDHLAPGINDPRLQLPHLSIGLKMLEIAGVVQGPSTTQDITLFADFRYHNQRQTREYVFDHSDLEEFKPQIDRLWQHTIQNASYIVGTTSNMGSQRILEALKHKTRVIIVDDAARQREDNLVPFFATNFSQLDAFIQVGNVLQSLPIVTTTKEESLFSDQGRLSFMTRLVASGFPVVRLTG